MNTRKFIRRFLALAIRKLHWLFSDKIYLKVYYFIKTGKRLNLKNPKSFNEKIQWLKLYDRQAIYSTMVDKYNVKKYVSKLIGEEYIIPTLGVWNSFQEIDFDKLPKQFVLKTTHDSGGVEICKDKGSFNFSKAQNHLNKSLRTKFYLRGKELPYKNVKPQIIAEQFMVDESNSELKDYKIFTFNGEPKFIQVDFDRFASHKRNIYDTLWNFIDEQIQYPNDKNRIINKPTSLSKMLDLAKTLSKNTPLLRVDFYSINSKIYFGELTLYHGSGFEKFSNKNFGFSLGSLISLPKSNLDSK